MVWPNLVLVLPLSLSLHVPSSRTFPSSCIINEPLILDRYNLRKLVAFRTLSHPLPFVAAVGHPPFQKKGLPILVCINAIVGRSRYHCEQNGTMHIKGFRTAACAHRWERPGSQYDTMLTQRDAGRGVNNAGIGSISNPASRCITLRHIVNRAKGSVPPLRIRFAPYIISHA